MPGITATIITLNESARLAAALESVRWADEVIVVDAESSDDTVAIARRYTDRVFVRPWPGYIEQKNFAASQAGHDSISSLDADERVTPALAGEIRERLAEGPACAGFRMPRVSRYLGRWFRSTDWVPRLPVAPLRPAQGEMGRAVRPRVRAGRWRGRPVAGGNRALSVPERLAPPADHQSVSSLAAQQLFEDGRRTGPTRIVIHAGAALLSGTTSSAEESGTARLA